MVEDEGPGVEVWQRVVDGLAADVAGWLVPCYSCAVLVTQRTVALLYLRLSHAFTPSLLRR